MANTSSATAKSAVPEAAAPQEKAEKVYLTIPTEPYVRKDILRKDGKTFNEVKLPSNMQIIGRTIGNGWSFNPLFVNESKYSSVVSIIPLLADREVIIKRDVLMRNTSTNKLVAMRDPSGKPLRETVSITPQELERSLTEALTAVPERDQQQDKRPSLSAQKAAAKNAEASREQERGPTERTQNKAHEIGG